MNTDESSDGKCERTDIVSIGAAAIDVFVRAAHGLVRSANGDGEMIQFPLGAKIKVEEALQTCGGGATNTAVGFSRLGMKARFCGVIGDDEWGESILQTLRKENVRTDAAIIVENEVSSFSIILVDAATGRRTILYSPNVNAHMCDPIFPKDMLRCSDWIFLNHLSDCSTVILDDCLELVTKPQGARFAWNPGGTQIRKGIAEPMAAGLLAETDLLFLNKEEALVFTGTETIPDAMKACTEIGVSYMCVSDGAAGADLTDGTTIWHAAVPDGFPIVDTTGAGDAFATGVTWGVWKGFSLPEALSAGMINAANVLGFMGTKQGLLSDTDITSRMKEHSLLVTQETLH